MRPARLAWAALLAAPILVGGAQAASDAETARAWGLFGTWASDCGVPPAQEMRYIYAADGATVRLYREGEGTKDSSPMSRVRVRPDGMLEYHVTFGRGADATTRVNVLAKRADGRTRMMINHAPRGGDYTVRDGRLVGAGRETSWDARCD